MKIRDATTTPIIRKGAFWASSGLSVLVDGVGVFENGEDGIMVSAEDGERSRVFYLCGEKRFMLMAALRARDDVDADRLLFRKVLAKAATLREMGEELVGLADRMARGMRDGLDALKEIEDGQR